MAGIPTLFANTQFRSRLEARWAHLFSEMRWQWEYEPFDTNGYIPDFLIIGKNPLLIEVKPVATYEEAKKVAAGLPELPYPVVVVGCIPFLHGELDCAGCYWEGDHDSVMAWSHCGEGTCGYLRFVPAWLGWENYPDSCEHTHKPGLQMGRSGDTAELFIEATWTRARNATQWKSPSGDIAA